MYEIHSCIIDIGHFTDLKKKKKLTQNCLGDDGLVPHDFLHDLKLLQVVNQIRFVQFSIVGSIMLICFCRSFRCT